MDREIASPFPVQQVIDDGDMVLYRALPRPIVLLSGRSYSSITIVITAGAVSATNRTRMPASRS